MQTSSKAELRMLHTDNGLEIDFRRSRGMVIAARFRHAVIISVALGIVIAILGVLVLPARSHKTPDEALGVAGTLIMGGIGLSIFSCALAVLSTVFPQMRQGADYNPSAFVRIVIGDEWVFIRDYRLRNRIKRRFLRDKVDGIAIAEGVGGTAFGALVIYLVDEDPLALMLRAPLSTLEPVATQIANDYGFTTQGDSEEGDGELEHDLFDDHTFNDDDNDGTQSLFGKDVA